ncbi:putative transporter [Smittium culicis]|uniref:Putative transporter n=1 Tax=Smittium culicis TaxID=133412 RepID=A0A1R1YFV7_9FUNG|nr:putative transporter [Smittium culicis]
MFSTYLYLSVRSIAEVIIVSLCGYYFSKIGVLNNGSLKALSTICVQLLIPCLIFSKLLKNVDLKLFSELWLTPITYLLLAIFSFVWVYFFGALLKIDRNYCRLLTVAVSCTNVNTLPLPILNSILSNPESKFLFKDENDTTVNLLARGVSYLFTFSIFSNIFLYSLGVTLIAKSKKVQDIAVKIENSFLAPSENTQALENVYNGKKIENVGLINQKRDVLTVNSVPRYEYNHKDNIFEHNSSKNAQLAFNITNNPTELPSEIIIQDPNQINSHHNTSTNKTSRKYSFKRFIENIKKPFVFISQFISAPVYAIILAIICVAIPPVKNSLLKPNSVPSILFNSITNIGDATSPIILISLGGQLCQMFKNRKLRNKNKPNSNDSTYTKLKLFFSTGIKLAFNSKKSNTTSDTENHRDFNSAANNECFIDFPDAAFTVKDEYIQPSSSKNTNSNTPAINNYKELVHGMNLNSSNLKSQNINCKKANIPDFLIERSDNNTDTAKPELYPQKGVIVVVLGRFIFMPVITLCFLILLKKYLSNHIPLLANDPVYFFTLLLVASTPPAVNIISIAQANGIYENDSANIMLWSYIIAIVSLSSEIGIYMWVTDILYNH